MVPPPGAWQAYQFGARGAPLAQATGLAASASARSFGGLLGKADIWNVITSGAVAGTFGTLKTRNPAFIAGSAAVGAALMGFMEGAQKFWRVRTAAALMG